jgi:hypothetical protein
MRRFVEGIDRGQTTLFPECLEDWIGEDNAGTLRGYLQLSGRAILLAASITHCLLEDAKFLWQLKIHFFAPAPILNRHPQSTEPFGVTRKTHPITARGRWKNRRSVAHHM